MKTRGKISLKRVVRPNDLSILNFKSVAPAAFYRTLIQPSCDPAHDDRSVCEVTQACYHVRGSGFHWVWDLIWDQWNLQGEPFIMFLLFRIRTSGNDVNNTLSVIKNCVSYLSWSSIHPSIHPFSFAWSGSWGATQLHAVITVCGTFWIVTQAWEQNQNL